MKLGRSLHFIALVSAGLLAMAETRDSHADLLLREDLSQAQELSSWCKSVKSSVEGFKWKIDPCASTSWQIGGHSVEGRPLVFTEFGDPNSQNTTLIFSMVHPDEVTPLYLGLELVTWVKEHESELGKSRVVIAPLVNPDGFFKKPRTRTNSRGVDCNRNFATHDWNAKALKAWHTQYKKNPRRFPGAEPRSEPETQFQEELIRRFQPQKILSVHAPLNMVDYDGPNFLSLARFPGDYVQRCMKLRASLKATSGGFFPGSLGNFAGQERGIPTITLELPTADARKAEQYWKQFSKGIKTMIEFTVPAYASKNVLKSEAEPQDSPGSVTKSRGKKM